MKVLAGFLFCSFLLFAENANKDCSPVKDGKICYSDHVSLKGYDRSKVFDALCKWARKEYGKDIFLSNVSVDKSAKTVFVSSKIKLLLTDTESTEIKFKIYITCDHQQYSVEAKNIRYIYEPQLVKRYKIFPAEEVIMNGGKDNKFEQIPDPELFCKATHYYFSTLFAQIEQSVKQALREN